MADFLQTRQDLAADLERGVTAVCDRYIDSFFAYNSREKIERPVYQAHLDCVEDGPIPDLTYLLLMDPDVAHQRANRDRPGGKTTEAQQRKPWNTPARLAEAQARYLAHLGPPRNVVNVWIDVNSSPEWVYENQIKPVFEQQVFSITHAEAS